MFTLDAWWSWWPHFRWSHADAFSLAIAVKISAFSLSKDVK